MLVKTPRAAGVTTGPCWTEYLEDTYRVGDRYWHRSTGQVVTMRRGAANWVRVQELGHRPFRVRRDDFDRNWVRVE